MQTYRVFKFDSKSVILKDCREYRVVEDGSDKSLFWNKVKGMWCESVFNADQLMRLATFIGERRMQLK